MATENQTATLTVLLNGEAAAAELKDLQGKAKSLALQIDEARKAGNETFAKQLTRSLQETNKSIGALKKEAVDVNKVLASLSSSTSKDLKKSLDSLNQKLNSGMVKRGSEEWITLQNHIRNVKKEIQSIQKESQVASGLEKIPSFWKNSLSAFTGTAMMKGMEMLRGLVASAKQFVMEGIKMAGTAEGVQTAFNKLNQPGLLKNLRTETKGLLTDFQLMQSAVKAKNFQIPVDKLGTLLKFAQQRAQETGESVDYLTDSIINGLGRKSPLILDNLGISAAKLQERAKKTGDFMQGAIDIVNEELAKQGNLALTAADKSQQAAVKWENAQLAIGKKMLWLGELWNKISGGIADAFIKMAKESKSTGQAFEEQTNKVAELELNIPPLIQRYEQLKSKTTLNKEEQTELNKIMRTLSDTIPDIIEGFDDYGDILSINTGKVYEYIEAEKKRLEYVNQNKLKDIDKEIDNYDKKIKQYKALLEAGKKEDARLIEKWTKERDDALKRGNENWAKEAQFFLNSIGKDITGDRKRYEEQIKEYSGLLKGATAEHDRLNGVTLDGVKKRMEFNRMNKEELDKWIKDEKNAASEYLNIAKEIYSSRFPKKTLTREELKTEQKKQLDKIEAEAGRKRVEAMTAFMNIQDKERYKNTIVYQNAMLEIERNTILEKQKLYEKDSKEYMDLEEKKFLYSMDRLAKLKSQQLKTPSIQSYLSGHDLIPSKTKERDKIFAKDPKAKSLMESGIADIKNGSVTKERDDFEKQFPGVAENESKLYEASLNYIADLESRNVISHDEAAKAKALIDQEYYQSLTDKAAEATDKIQNITGNLSSAISGFQEAETMAVELKYNKLIKAAGKNSKEAERLEEKKQAEINKIKAEYADKQFIVTIAQVVASTAVSAMNAFAAMSSIPVIGPALGAAAAAAAIAAGAAQIAVAKQQRDAAKEGYASGGFTPSGRWDEPQGMVHSGEFVGNRFAVQNPAVRKVFDIVDMAQRNNTVSALTERDFARALDYREAENRYILNGISSALAPMNADRTDDMQILTAIAGYLDRNAEINDRLTRRLDEPFVGEVSITGRRGIKENLDLYEKIIKNASR